MSTLLFHVRLTCTACHSDTVVNMEQLSAKRAALLAQAMGLVECGVCKKLTMHGEVRPGHSTEAKMVVRDAPMTWDRKKVAEYLRRKQDGDGSGK